MIWSADASSTTCSAEVPYISLAHGSQGLQGICEENRRRIGVSRQVCGENDLLVRRQGKPKDFART